MNFRYLVWLTGRHVSQICAGFHSQRDARQYVSQWQNWEKFVIVDTYVSSHHRLRVRR